MNTSTISATPGTVIQRQRDFSAVISRDESQADTKGSARQAAEDFVAMAFVEPLLSQLRESNNAAPPFAPGAAERQFGEIMDQVLSRQIVRASHFPLVQRLESDMTTRSEALQGAQNGLKEGVLA